MKKIILLAIVATSLQGFSATNVFIYPGQSTTISSDGSQVICLPGFPPPPRLVTCETDLTPSGLDYVGNGASEQEAKENLLKYCISKQQFSEPLSQNCQTKVVSLAICRY